MTKPSGDSLLVAICSIRQPVSCAMPRLKPRADLVLLLSNARPLPESSWDGEPRASARLARPAAAQADPLYCICRTVLPLVSRAVRLQARTSRQTKTTEWSSRTSGRYDLPSLLITV